jgi:hypothetical protein
MKNNLLLLPDFLEHHGLTPDDFYVIAVWANEINLQGYKESVYEKIKEFVPAGPMMPIHTFVLPFQDKRFNITLTH